MRQPLVSPIRYFFVRSVTRLVGELTVSTLATLIVTAALSNLYFAARTAPSAPIARPSADAVIFSPQPLGPGNNGLEPVTLGLEPVTAARDRLTRDLSSGRKIPRPPVRNVEPAAPVAVALPAPPIQPPLQLSSASMVAAPSSTEPSDNAAADAPAAPSGRFHPVTIIFRPIHTIAGQLSWLLPKF
jgi:hypothetical protein